MPTTLTHVFQIGEPVEHRGIVVAPLFPTRDPVARYVTLDEALPRGLRITETDESGSVPELVAHNPLEADVLLYDGEELVGAKQNRILNVTVLAPAGKTIPIPVTCVEQGRWRWAGGDFASARHISAHSCGASRPRRRPHSRSPAGWRRAPCGRRSTRCSTS